MRPTAVLASALVRPVVVLTAVCSSRRWLGTSCTEYSTAMSLASVQGSAVHGSGGGGKMGKEGGGWDGIRTCGVIGIGDSGMGGGGAEDQGGGPESGGYKDSVGGSTDGGGDRRGGGRVGDGSGVDGDDGGSDHGVGDADNGGKGDCGNEGAVTRLLPAEVLSALVRLGTTPAWACCARRWLSCTACVPTARARWLVSAPVETTTPGGSGGHVPHATGHLVRAMKYEAHAEGCAEK